MFVVTVHVGQECTHHWTSKTYAAAVQDAHDATAEELRLLDLDESGADRFNDECTYGPIRVRFFDGVVVTTVDRDPAYADYPRGWVEALD